jgi:hypothetical protein
VADDILCYIRSDPEQSHRPAEAVRIALGLISSEHAVTIVLAGRAPLLLADDLDTIVDGEVLQKYLPTLREMDVPFHVERAAWDALSVATEFRVVPVTPAEIARLTASARQLLVF